MELTLDGMEINSIEQLHKLLKEKLQLPEYYGENLNALWDCLTAWVDMPLKISWLHFQESKRILGSSAEEFLELFRDAEDELEGFTFEVIL
ncbi:barstar family protein [Paenibacillus sediminis]|uniref:Ribonuclease inhibitor n=2 Tax=Paenibacillus sediminis TaxID=664909 RepID=A0ABS4GZA2_9BACL|nr:ribonuclease inhibitor [Paenibacillus sediminis]